MAEIYGPAGTALEEGNVSLQTWLPDGRYYEEVVRRNDESGVRWALVTLTEDLKVDDRGAIPIHLG